MSDKVVAAFVAAGISFVGIIVSLITTWLSNQASRRRLLREIEGEFSQFLYKERLECYTEAFEITGRLKRRKAPEYLNSFKEITSMAEKLFNWSSGKGGLLMSGRSITACRELYVALSKQPGHGSYYSQEQADKIWQLRGEFRRALRRDVLFLSPYEGTSDKSNKPMQ